MSLESMKRICRVMPKVELHAHLNGSISEDMLERIATLKNGHSSPPKCNSKIPKDYFHNFHLEQNKLDLPTCFAKFRTIHEAVTTKEILNWVTKEVIQDFAEDNVVYLELRTTPKIIHSISSKDIYIRCVVDGIIEAQEELPIIVKLLISVDRKMSVEDGLENVQLAVKWAEKYPNIVVGVDFSGDPSKGTFLSFLPSLEKAKAHGLPISCHLPEIPNFDETMAMLQFLSSRDRVGHACYLHPERGHGSQTLWDGLKNAKIPVEVCLTSNLVTNCCTNIYDHHVKFLDEDKMPFAICDGQQVEGIYSYYLLNQGPISYTKAYVAPPTDDQGIFQTSLSLEYYKLIQLEELNFSPDKLRRLCVQTVDHIFGTEEEKSKIKIILSTYWDAELKELKKVD